MEKHTKNFAILVELMKIMYKGGETTHLIRLHTQPVITIEPRFHNVAMMIAKAKRRQTLTSHLKPSQCRDSLKTLHGLRSSANEASRSCGEAGTSD